MKKEHKEHKEHKECCATKGTHTECNCKKEETSCCSADCKCDSGCTCGGSCSCDCGANKGLLVKSAVTLVSALIIAGAISCAHKTQKLPVPQPMPAPANIDASIERYIKENTASVMEIFEKYAMEQEKKARAEEAARPQATADKKLVDEIINDKTNMVLGNPKGSFVIIEFFDYQCGWCKRTNKEISEALKNAPNIRWILMDSPIFGEVSEKIALYSMAAGKQGKFKEMHDAITEAKGRLDENALIELGKSIGLNTEKLKADANGEELKNKLAKNKEYAKTLKIGGVPMLIVDGKINPGALIGDRLAAAVEASKKK